MSTTVDNRVVEMQFDNAQFERNVSTSLSTLEKLKQSLNLTGAAKGLESVGSAARGMNLSGIGSAAETVGLKFNAMYTMADQALRNITNSAYNAGKRIISALTIDPVKTGFAEYETQINAIQTILANTESKGTTMDDVNTALDTLNKYADKTIYNFTEMTRNIGTFTAAGVDLDTSVSAIQGIANLAAVSGSTSQQASTAMYQLSQALSSGTVRLQDWNSVVNAGMGGQVFQDALKRTAENMGTNVDALIKKYGSFRDSLTQGEWLTTEVLTKTLEQFTMAAEEGSAEWEKYKKSLMDEGYTAKQAEEILKMANRATDAATKVKTFTQLWDTLKEAAQSGWTQTWEIIVGDFKEAKELLTNISNVVGDFINKTSEARNNLLQGWKDAGGRTQLIEALTNAFKGVINIAKPIAQAFREIFPPTTVDQLMNFTEGFKELTARFAAFTEKHAGKIKEIFTGVFSAIDIVIEAFKAVGGGAIDIIKKFAGVETSVLDMAASIGGWLTNVRDSVKSGDLFSKIVDKITGIVGKAIDKLKELGTSIKDAFKDKAFNGVYTFFKGLWGIISKVGSKIGEAFTAIGSGLSDAFGGSYFDNLMNGGMFAGLLVMLKKMIGLFENLSGDGSFMDNIRGMLDDVRESIQAYQEQLKAGSLLKIASAIGILAAAIFVISTIDPGDLDRALLGITAMFGELIASLSLISKIDGKSKGMMKAIPLLIALSTSLLIFAAAMKVMSTISWSELGVGLVGLTVGLGAMVGAINLLPEKKVMSSAKAIKQMAVALVILAAGMKIMSTLSWQELGLALTGVVGGLGALVAAVNLLPKDAGVRTVGMIGLATAMVILGGAMKIMATMSWDELGRGLAGVAGSLAAIVIAMNLMPKDMALRSLGMVGLATAMVILGGALKIMGSMTWEQLAIGLVAMGGALAELAIALNLMNGTLAGSAALIIAAGALAIIAPVMKSLGEMAWGEILKGLAGLAGAFVVIGVAGLLLAPIIPAILGLAGALALIGIAALGIGAGLALAGVGLTTLGTGLGVFAAALAASATAIVAGLTVIITGILDLIPTVCEKIGEGIIAFAAVITNGAPALAEAVGALLSALIDLGITYIPKIVDFGMKLIIGLLEGIAKNAKKLISAATDLIVNFIEGIGESIPRIIQAGIDLVINFINGMANGIRNNNARMIDAVNNLMDAVIGAIGAWLKNFVSKGKEMITNIVSGIKSAVSSAVETAKSIGKDIVNGFVDGVKNKAKKAIDAAKGVVSDALEGAKKLLGINSPSREFAKLGEGSDEGYILGLKRYSKNVASAAADVGSVAIKSMSNSISEITDILSGNVDAQPTIRPVVDLTNVKAGAGTINDLMSIGSSIGVSANVSAISSMMARRGQNGDNADVVSAINKLRKDLGNVGNTSYNINGVTYDDGSNVSTAVKEIVRAARIERRV